MSKSKRGFASLPRDEQLRIASMGGVAAHRKGTAHEFTSKEAVEAGRKGGLARARKRKAAMMAAQQAQHAQRKEAA